MPDILSDFDSEPTIRPILDLSDVRKGAAFLNGMMADSDSRISFGTSYSSAKEASSGYKANQEASGSGFTANHTEVTYIQNNTSPKALSSAEIYRQTNNQLSRTKGALTSANPGRS